MAIGVGALIGAAAASKGMDVANDFGSQFLSNYLGGKNEKVSLYRQYSYAKKYALNSPSWNVEGLRNAGLNPILAATDGAFSSPTVPSVGRNNPSGNSGSSVNLAQSLIANEQLRQQELVNRSIIIKNNADAEKARSSAILDGIRSANETVTKGLGGVVGGTAAAYKEAKSLFDQGVDAVKEVFNYFNTPALNKYSPSSSSKTSHEIKSRNAPDDGKGGSSYKPDYDDDFNIPNHGTFKSRHSIDGKRRSKLREGRNPYFYK